MNLCIRGFNPLISPVLLLALSVWIAVSPQAAAAQTEETVPASVESKQLTARRVKVQVTVTCDGKFVAEVPFTAQYDRAIGQGVTNSNGRVVLEVDVPTSARMVAVYPRPPLPPPGTRMPVFLWHQQEYLRLIAPYAFANWYRVELRPGEDSYELSIAVTRARRATLHVEAPEQPGTGAIAISRSSASKLNRPDADGRIVVAGLPKGEPAVVYIGSSRPQDRIARAVRVEVAASEDDVELGHISIEPDTETLCEARIKLHPSTDRLWRPDSAPGGVTIVSLDGRRIYTFARGGQVLDSRGAPSDSVLVRVPAGEYYVVGEVFGATLAQTSVIERARTGEDLRKLGVPTIVASPERIAEFEIDQWNVEKLILGGEDNTDRPDYTPLRP